MCDDKPHLFSIDDKPHLFSADDKSHLISADDKPFSVDDKPPLLSTGEKPPLFSADNKPHIFSTDNKPHLFSADNKPHLFAADSSKKSDTPEFIMPENIRKRRSITVKEKLDILNMVDSGHKLSAVAREFGISSSTASTIVKERYKIKLLSDHYNIDPERKRMRLGIYRDVDEAVHLWFRQMRMKNIPINGPMLQQKAREFAIQLGHLNFEGSSGWLFRFRERHGLTQKAMRVNEDNNAVSYSGVGMTDDEIVTSVCQNTVHSLNFCDKINIKKEKEDGRTLNNSLNLEVPENYLVPEVELTPYEPTISLHEAVIFTEKLTAFLKGHDVPSDILKSMNTVTNFIDHDLRNQLKQKKITDYFKP